MDKEKVKKLFENEGYGISEQGLKVLSRLENPEKVADDMAKTAKKTKWIFGGADVLRFMIRGDVTNSPGTSGDLQ